MTPSSPPVHSIPTAAAAALAGIERRLLSAALFELRPAAAAELRLIAADTRTVAAALTRFDRRERQRQERDDCE